MSKYLLDTNIVLDAQSAEILGALNFSMFYVSYLVLYDEILKQVSNFNYENIMIIKETNTQIGEVVSITSRNNKISTYDAINLVLARDYNFTLVTGDQKLKDEAIKYNIKCIGTLGLIKKLIEINKISVVEAIIGLEKLKSSPDRRIPHQLIDKLVVELKEGNKKLV